MRAAENRNTDDVIAFPLTQETTDPVAPHGKVPDAVQEAKAPLTTVLNAERGIINTGVVHGGQHVTAVELSGHADGRADGYI
ncbi:S-type pyocin domain-containing protein [Streptomyces sp. CA-294286]|uniref:S-type pyocin domain-containing protein n=1 Tax=Streptomyces sp. CA-294286 TaxID=3240070 RepID=UPI003D8D0258